MVVRPVEIVTGLDKIGKLFGVGRNTVRAWASVEDSPIRLVEGKVHGGEGGIVGVG